MNSFREAAVKTLSSVEVDGWQSNQHEFHGVLALKRIFGQDRQYFRGNFFYVERSGQIQKDVGELTWYDAREYSPDRSEYRLYYSDNAVVNRAEEGDTLFVVLCDNNVVKIIIVERGTQFADVLKTSLGISRNDSDYHVISNLGMLNELASVVM